MGSTANYLWPARQLMTITNKRGKVYCETNDRRYDLFDRLMMSWPLITRTVYLSISSKGKDWHRWNEENLQQIERLIRYDLNFDDCAVNLTRMTTSARPLPCTEPFQWRLRIRNKLM